MIKIGKVNENEYIGLTINDLTIIGFVGRKSNNLVFKAKCKVCGREKNVWLKDFKKGSGTNHRHCIRLIGLKNISKRFRDIWAGMRDRTTNLNCEHYDSYGGRGISSEDYKDFIDFYDDFYKEYINHSKIHGEKNTTIERIDVNGNYCKENITFATWEEQHRNTRRNKKILVTYPNGNTEVITCVAEFIRNHVEIKDPSSIYDCLKGERKNYKGYTFKYLKTK